MPVIKEDEIHIADSGEVQIDVSRDPRRMIFDLSEPFYMPGNKTVIAVPFDGDADFSEYSPRATARARRGPKSERANFCSPTSGLI